MKRVLISLLILVIFLSGCGGTATKSSSDVIEVKEKLFITQVNEIYFNANDYIGKTIKLEGLLDCYTEETTGNTHYYVIRYGPGCCGNDGNAGFEVKWDKQYPNENDWVEAVGTLTTYQIEGMNYLMLDLKELNVLSERGAETVKQ